MAMQKQHSEYVVIVHPKHGEKKTLSWVAEALVKKGWKKKEVKATKTGEKTDGKADN
ncbi:hypothetical protein [Prosthecochloris sp. ZM]|uniref:hypothetical protein n=1 Tax=Prosthecochloris sp. ZM TaxID=2283143 RepID=UPI001294698A|nr:hypothetical protein [Prosthecochloris sp. ZM]